MVVNLLPWLLHGVNRTEYTKMPYDSRRGAVVMGDVDVFMYCLVVIIAARLAFTRFFGAAANRLAAEHGRDAAHRDGRKLLEECWVLCGNVGMLALAAFIMARRNGGCSFSSTRPCLAGWPRHAVDPLSALYYNLELAWYGHLLLKPVLQYGQRDGRDMVAHHLSSMALLLSACALGLSRMGVVALALFGISNPLLHIAKIANQLDLKVKLPAFFAFAAVFFLTRVVLVPLVVLYATLLETRRTIPYAVHDFFPAYVLLNVLLVVLYAMQLVWMHAIVRVLRQAATAGADAASRMSARVDPAKRYAEAAAPAGPAVADIDNGR